MGILEDFFDMRSEEQKRTERAYSEGARESGEIIGEPLFTDEDREWSRGYWDERRGLVKWDDAETSDGSSVSSSASSVSSSSSSSPVSGGLQR